MQNGIEELRMQKGEPSVPGKKVNPLNPSTNKPLKKTYIPEVNFCPSKVGRVVSLSSNGSG